MKAPFVYFGGKSAIASYVWAALGQPAHYIEPFFGKGAVLLGRPRFDATTQSETICDADGFVANVWRALQADPDAVAKVCDWPVNHADLTARKAKLIAEGASLLDRLCADETYFDVKLAGYWIWAASCWIGSGMMRPNAIPNISNGGKGVHARGQIPHVTHGGQGVHARGKIPHVSDGGEVPDVREPYNTNLWTWFRQLSERLRYVRVVCGDWTRVCGGDWQDMMGPCGIFCDPPYSEAADRDDRIYHVDCQRVAADVQAWCRERGPRGTHRIVLAGYFEEHASLLDVGWRCKRWSANGGYGRINRDGEETKGMINRHREALFFSPHCVHESPLFADMDAVETLPELVEVE